MKNPRYNRYVCRHNKAKLQLALDTIEQIGECMHKASRKELREMYDLAIEVHTEKFAGKLTKQQFALFTGFMFNISQMEFGLIDHHGKITFD